MPKYGLLLENLLPSQETFYLLNHANHMMANNPDNCFYIFIDDILPPIFQPLCPIFNSTEIASFNDATIITTNISHTLQCLSLINNSKIKFYVRDLEWMRNSTDYFTNIKAFNHHSVEVIARSYDHAKMIKNYSNINNIRVVKDYNLKDILYGHY